MTNQELQTKILRRVKRIHTLRRVTSPLALKVYTLFLGGVGTISLVSVQNVINNFPREIGGWYSFTADALLNTELAVQIFLSIAAISAVWLVRDITRTLKAPIVQSVPLYR